MAGYPQIPSTVWWGLRNVLKRSPNATIDEKYLGVQLEVQEVAARQYVSELKRVGLLTEDGKGTPLAARWRHDETYWSAVQELMKAAYPESLLQVAPPGEADRQKVISWFERDGLGSGTASNKAATYFLMSSATPGEAPTRNAGSEKAAKAVPAKSKQQTKPPGAAPSAERKSEQRQQGQLLPLNINMQIHISADATSEQIESIFAAMRRYLYDNPAS